MAEVKWIKIVTDIFDDEKIKYIETMPQGDTLIVIWFKILCMCGKSNQGGLLMMTDAIAYTDEMLSSVFNRPMKTVMLALKTFQNLEMIEIIDDKYYLPNWEKHQSIDKLDQIREQGRIRKENERKRKKQGLISMSRDSNVTVTNEVTPSHAIEEEVEEDIENTTTSINNNTRTQEKLTFQKCVDLVQNTINPNLNSFDFEFIKGWFDLYDPELIFHAIKETAIYKKSNIKYTDTILRSWALKNYTVEDVKKLIHPTKEDNEKRKVENEKFKKESEDIFGSGGYQSWMK
jgi:predicted phage replisome organizer